jgi:hypothetical protein
LLAWLVRGAIDMGRRMREKAWVHTVRRNRKPGYLVIVAPFDGPRAERTRAYAEAAVSVHFASFSFNAPFEVLGSPRRFSERAREAEARAMMVTTEADMIVWGREIVGGTQNGVRLEGLARQPGDTADRASVFSLVIPGRIAGDSSDMARLLAYALCRELQPALARPQDFRADRLEPIARRFGAMLEAHKGIGPTPVLRQLQDDYAISALHLGETGRDRDWLERASRAFEAVIAQGRSAEPDRWINAKLGLGRAMLALAELRFDPVRIQEGTAHIRAALDVLRGHAKLRVADQGLAAIQKADRMLENRRRFSITWPV